MSSVALTSSLTSQVVFVSMCLIEFIMPYSLEHVQNLLRNLDVCPTYSFLGILHDPGHPKAPERKLADVNREWLAKTLEVRSFHDVLYDFV